MQIKALGNALAIALISALLMLGALSISLVEFGSKEQAATTIEPVSTLPIVTINLPQPSATTEVVPTPLIPVDTPTETITPLPTITSTPFALCSIPAGWIQVYVQQYDTLTSIATRYNTTAEQLRAGNCLLVDNLIAGTTIHVPPVSQPVACTSGASGWIKGYIVRSGDTVYSIAIKYNTTSARLKTVNCRTSDLIYVGELLWVPNIPATLTPLPTFTSIPGDTAVPFPTDPLTETPLPYTSTPAPTPVPPTPTAFPTATLTQ